VRSFSVNKVISSAKLEAAEDEGEGDAFDETSTKEEMRLSVDIS